jgi:hypothetical protein
MQKCRQLCRLLPECRRSAPEGMSSDHGAQDSSSRRERRAGWQLRFLEDDFQFNRSVRAQDQLELHAKGTDQEMIDVALATKQPVVMSPKVWAEHFGLPYQQAAIRELEMPRTDRQTSGLMKLSSGSRSFLRYGYGDLLKEAAPLRRHVPY